MDDNKKSTTIWLRPSVISRMDGWLEADNCQSRSEFVDIAALGRIFDSVEDALKGLIKILILGRVFPNIGEELAGQNKKALCPDQIFSGLLRIRVRQFSIIKARVARFTFICVNVIGKIFGDIAVEQHSNVSVSAVRSWEQEKSSPPHELLVTICKLYHVSSDYLLGLASEDPTDSNQKTGQFSNIELEELQNFKNYLLWKRRN